MRTREKLHKEVSENRQRLNQTVQQLQNQRRELAKQLEDLQDRCDAEEKEMRKQLSETRKEAEELKLALAAQQVSMALIQRACKVLSVHASRPPRAYFTIISLWMKRKCAV